MKYYIFADSTPNITCNINQCVKSSDNYYELRDYFNFINSEYRFYHSYLVADFNTYKPSSKFSKSNLATLDNIEKTDDIPFLIIGEFHFDPETNKCNIIRENGKMVGSLAIRKDYISLKSEGFTRVFYDNEAALETFLYYVKHRSPITMSIKVSYTKDINKEVILDRFVASSVSILRSKRSYIDKISITKDIYKSIKPNRKLYNFDLKAEQSAALV